LLIFEILPNIFPSNRFLFFWGGNDEMGLLYQIALTPFLACPGLL